MKRYNVTVTTDASFYLKEKVGGFAFQIRSNKGLEKSWGPFQESVTNPTEAEMKSLLNALWRLKELDIKIHTLTINTDCEFIVNNLFNYNPERKRINIKLARKVKRYLNRLDYKHLNIKHVKAHSEIINSRRFVNDWCDRHSRMGSYMASDIKNGRPINYVPENLAN